MKVWSTPTMVKGDSLIHSEMSALVFELEGVRVAEVLPSVFANLSARGSLPTNTLLQVIRNPELVEVENQAPLSVSASLALRAISILSEALGLGDDLTPGLDPGSDSVAFAALVAAAVHAEQRDKSGFPYIEHPRRVFLKSEWSIDPEKVIEAERVAGYQAAWLHDVLEDSQKHFYRKLDAADLARWGFDSRVCAMVSKLTRRDNGPEFERNYYRQFLQDSTARAVKLADIADNIANWRTQLLKPEMRSKLKDKYDHALSEMFFEESQEPWFEVRVDTFDEGPWPMFCSAESVSVLAGYQGDVEPQVTEDKPRIIFERKGSIRRTEQALNQAREILHEMPWRFYSGDPEDPRKLLDYSLDAWYSTLACLHLRGRGGDEDAEDNAQLLAEFLDSVPRQKSVKFKHLDLVPRNVNYEVVKQAVRDALGALSLLGDIQMDYVLRSQNEQLVRIEMALTALSDEELLVCGLLAFMELSRQAQEQQKMLVIEMLRRAGKG